MKLLITGGAGFLGVAFARQALQRGRVLGQPLSAVVLADRVAPPADLQADARVTCLIGDLADQMQAIADQAPQSVVHLASAVSGECEADFDLGMRSNLQATMALLETLRHIPGVQRPRLLFASSVAVFGNDPAIPMPAPIGDSTLPTPQSSYGIQKFVCEQLIADYTRKGFIDGRVARLMTVAVRPGRPNGAASGFLSGIIREPLAGIAANCPVSLDTEVAVSSPRNTLAGMWAVLEADRSVLPGRTAVNLSALTVTVGAMIAALEAVAGKAATRLISYEPQVAVARIVGGWPSRFDTQLALRLGLSADPDFESVVRQYVQDHPDAIKLDFQLAG